MYLALLEIHATRCANRQVDTVSNILFCSADTVAIIAVTQLPPKLSRNTIVNKELR